MLVFIKSLSLSTLRSSLSIGKVRLIMKNKIPQGVLGPYVNIMGKIQLLVPKIAGVLSILLRDSNMAILPIYGIKNIVNANYEWPLGINILQRVFLPHSVRFFFK